MIKDIGEKPLVTVVVPVGPGHEEWFGDALESVRRQTFPSWELILVNDTGGPLDLAPYPYARVVELDGGSGPGLARNRGLERARGDFFVCLDADDYLEPEFLERTVELQKRVGGWVYTDYYEELPDGAKRWRMLKDWDVERLWTSGLAPITALYPLSGWVAAGGFAEEGNREDWDFHLRLAVNGFCGIRLAEPLFTYRSWTGMRRKEPEIADIARRLQETYPLEEIRMACRGCGRRATRKVRQSRRTAAVEREERVLPLDDSWVGLVYTGSNPNALVLTGRSGRQYNVSRENPVVLVEARDARRFLTLGCFRRATDEDMEALQLADLPDPAALTVAEVRALELRREQAAALLRRELEGKARKSVIRYLERLSKEVQT